MKLVKPLAFALVLPLALAQEPAARPDDVPLPFLMFDEGVVMSESIDAASTALYAMVDHLNPRYGDVLEVAVFEKMFFGPSTSFYFVLEYDDGAALQEALLRVSGDREYFRLESTYNDLLSSTWRDVFVPLEGRRLPGRAFFRDWRSMEPEPGRRADAVRAARALTAHLNAAHPEAAAQLYTRDVTGAGELHLFWDHPSAEAWQGALERLALDQDLLARADELDACLVERGESILLMRSR